MSGNVLHINEIKLEGEDPWTKLFNKCSELFMGAMDESKPEEEREALFAEWRYNREQLELGLY
jgi:hypothetical protein